MELKTALSCGDKAWTFDGDRIRLRTVGQVQVTATESDGIGDGLIEGIASYSGGNHGQMADNYAPMPLTVVEKYMCVETGIGSGSVYTLGESIFLSEEACRTANAERLAELEAERRAAAKWREEQRTRRLHSLRAELAILERESA